MPRTFTNLLTHCIFSTKQREALIVPAMQSELHAYLGGLAREAGGTALAINSVADHAHMLVKLPPAVALSEAMRLIKANSSKWVHEKWPDRASFAWQLGFGAFSVSKSNVPDVMKYIADQEEHHRRFTFQEEFLGFLRNHQVEYDERYIWE
jgi:putative transposase